MQRALSFMPAVARQMLVDPDTSGALQAVNAEAFLKDLFHPKSADSIAAFVALRDVDPSKVLLPAPAALTEREALRVRKWAETKLAVEGDGNADSVDEAPTFQVSLDWTTLESLIGVEGGKRLTALAMPFLERSAVTEDLDPNDDLLLSIGVIVRKYTPGERPFIGFHVDNNVMILELHIFRHYSKARSHNCSFYRTPR